MKKSKLTIYILLASVILTSCIKNKQQLESENNIETNNDQDGEVYPIDTVILEDSSNTIDITTDCLPVDDNTTVYVDTITHEKVYTSVDFMPEFTGGAMAMKNFFKDNLSSNLDSQGRVIVRFVVDSKGNIKDPTVLRSLSPDCDKEALRVIKMMPQWTPGKKEGEGETVSVYYTLPVLFKSNK